MSLEKITNNNNAEAWSQTLMFETILFKERLKYKFVSRSLKNLKNHK